MIKNGHKNIFVGATYQQTVAVLIAKPKSSKNETWDCEETGYFVELAADMFRLIYKKGHSHSRGQK